MATLTYPSGIDFLPESFAMWPEPNVLTSTAPLTKSVRRVRLTGSPWRMRLGFDRATPEGQAEREAFWNSVGGQENLIALHNFRRPVPRGTMRGTPTLSALAAKGATQIVLSNAMGTNLLTYPQEFDNADWSKIRASVTSNATLAPDGTITADKVVEDSTASSTHAVSRIFDFVAGTKYALSAHVQTAERTQFRLQFPDAAFPGAGNIYANFDASTQSVLAQSSGISAAIAPAGDGWCRASIEATAEASASGAWSIFLIASGGVTYTGDGTSGLYLWGAQLEAGTLTDYDPYATLKAGDMLGLGGALVQVASNAIADAAGVMTVSILPKLLAEVAAGTAVVWDRPTANFMARASGHPVGHSANYGEPFEVDLVQA